MTAPPIRVALVGLGATGRGIGQLVLARDDMEIVAVADISPELAGQEIEQFLPGAPTGLRVATDLSALTSAVADVAVVTVGSYLSITGPVVETVVKQGLNAVSICEELSFPFVRHEAWATTIDELAKASNVSVLGTGCNPGYVMDALPAVLTAACGPVDRLQVRRMADVSRFGSGVAKHGLGMMPDEYDATVAAGQIRGHIGFYESLDQLADAFGVDLYDIELEGPERVSLTSSARAGRWRSLPAGSVAVVKQTARARFGEAGTFLLEEYLGFPTGEDDAPMGDQFVIGSGEHALRVEVPEGFDSYRSTVGIAANMIPPVVRAAPGLRVMIDFSLRDVSWNNGRRSK